MKTTKKTNPTRLNLEVERLYERWLWRQVYRLRWWFFGSVILLFCLAGWLWLFKQAPS